MLRHEEYAVQEKMNRLMREASAQRLVNQVQHNHPKPNLGQRLQESVEAPGSLATES